MHVKGPGEPIDHLYKQVTDNGKGITADGLYSLRREAIKDKALSGHEAEVLQKAVDLYNKTAGADRQVTLVDLTGKDAAPQDELSIALLGKLPPPEANEKTVTFHQGPTGVNELDEEKAGRAGPLQSLSFKRFVHTNQFENVFRDQASLRHLPYLVDSDTNTSGDTVASIVGKLSLGQSETFGSVKELQHFLNAHRAEGAKKIREDGRLGPETTQAVRARLEARLADAETGLALTEVAQAARVLFDAPSNGKPLETIGWVQVPNLRDQALAKAIKDRAQFVLDHPAQIQITPKGKLSID